MKVVEDIDVAIEEALRLLRLERGDKLATDVTPIILTNLVRGRVQQYLKNRVQAKVENYVWRVADHYEKSHQYITRVQIEKNTEIWQFLYEQLQKWAYNFLCRRSFPTDGDKKSRFDHAVTCASEAGAVLVNAHFPYDVEFDPWAHVLLQQVCLKYISRAYTRMNMVEGNLIELDSWDDWLNNLGDPKSLQGEMSIQNRMDLQKAIEQLSSEARKEFIHLYYFEHFTFHEIAVKMEKTVNALYKLHHDALKELSKKMTVYKDING